MSQQYKNVSKFLEEKEYVVKTTEEEFLHSKNIEYVCIEGHITKLAIISFINKRSKYKDDYSQLCTTCVKDSYNNERFIREKEIILKSTGHILVKLENRENAIYICGKCESENNTYLVNLKRNLGSCPKCQNEQFKKSIDEVNEKIKDKGVEVLEYKNNKEVVAKCVCEKEYKTTVADINRDRLCMECKKDRTEKTNIEKYGCKNVFQNSDIKQKIKNTNEKKFGPGITHHLKVPEIKEKVRKTHFERYGTNYTYQTAQSVKKQKEAMLQKYGVEYPLQSEFVQAKIRETFLKTIGYEYPLQSKEIRDDCILKSKASITEKYGVDSFFKSQKYRDDIDIYQERSKNTCLERYGVDNYFKSEKYKKLCIEIYGCEHPIQNPQVFSKAQKSLYSKKEYTFPSGKKTYIRGYEPHCIDDLLKTYNEDEIITETVDIPTISYKKYGMKKNAVYYPDILLPDKLVEVKSKYTLQRDLENNILKIKACLNSGYRIELRVYDRNCECIYSRLFTVEDVKKVGVILKKRFELIRPRPILVFED